MATLLEKAKAVCRVTSTAFDDELSDLLEAGLSDIGISDIKASMLVESEDLDPLINRALMTYVSMNFKLNNGQVDTTVYDRMLDSYNMQKSQLITATGYRDWGV